MIVSIEVDMRNHVEVAVIGGGVVGGQARSKVYLTKAGWRDVLLIERRGTHLPGSSWHAAGGTHAVNGDPNVAKLQQYTINLYRGDRADFRPVLRRAHHRRHHAGRHAASAWTGCKMAKARGRYLGMDLELISPFRKRRSCSPCGREAFRRRDVRLRSKATSIRTA
jgi:dimethylglycine dehydrogenase